jgi:hypothetical protein
MGIAVEKGWTRTLTRSMVADGRFVLDGNGRLRIAGCKGQKTCCDRGPEAVFAVLARVARSMSFFGWPENGHPRVLGIFPQSNPDEQVLNKNNKEPTCIFTKPDPHLRPSPSAWYVL